MTAFSEAPIRACTLLGGALVALAVVLTAAGFVRWLQTGNGHLVLLVAAMAGVGGLQLVATGLVGEYVWRALEESRRRPQYVLERVTAPVEAQPPAAV